MEAPTGTLKFGTRFPSSMTTSVPVNNSVPLYVFVPNDKPGPFPCVLILHYWGAGDHRGEFNMATELARRGIAGAVLSLPYHIERVPKGERSGERAITPNPDHLVETMKQSVFDIRRALDMLGTREFIRPGSFGITGTSLGAVVAALVIGLDPRIQHGAFVVGGVDLAHIVWTSSRTVKVRDQMRGSGLTESRLREALQEIEPSLYLAEHRPQSAYVVMAKFDTVIHPSDSEKLISLLGSPAVLRLEQGHYGGFFIQKQIQRSVGDYFSKVLFGESFQAPTDIQGPTIRLGVTLDSREGMDVAAGIDLIRPRNTTDIYLSAVISPDDFRLFLGKPIDRSLSIGIFFAKSQPQLGLYWSIVL
jgi:dienelactone hydrolase